MAYSEIKKEKPGCPYWEIREKMTTFDLLLFRGTDFVSNAIARVEAFEDGRQVRDIANFTHAGLVIRGRDLMPPITVEEAHWLCMDGVYVLESTMSGKLADGCYDVNGKTHLGVQLRNLDDVVMHYDAKPAARLACCRHIRVNTRGASQVCGDKVRFERHRSCRVCDPRRQRMQR